MSFLQVVYRIFVMLKNKKYIQLQKNNNIGTILFRVEVSEVRRMSHI